MASSEIATPFVGGFKYREKTVDRACFIPHRNRLKFQNSIVEVETWFEVQLFDFHHELEFEFVAHCSVDEHVAVLGVECCVLF